MKVAASPGGFIESKRHGFWRWQSSSTWNRIGVIDQIDYYHPEDALAITLEGRIMGTIPMLVRFVFSGETGLTDAGRRLGIRSTCHVYLKYDSEFVLKQSLFVF